MKSIKDVKAWDGANRYKTAFSKLDAKQQLTVLLDEFGMEHLHRSKGVSFNTKKARAYICFQFIDTVREGGMNLRSLNNLGQKHLAHAVCRWERDGLSAATMQTRVSILRWLAAGLGKSGMVKDATAYGVSEARIQRQYVAQKDKSWTGHEIIPQQKIEEVAKVDPWVGVQLGMSQAFGLRVAEAIMIRPHSAHQGDTLRIEEGTKGGRTRLVQIRTQEQAVALLRAKEMAARTARGSLCPPGRKLAQAKNRLYYVCRVCGITKDQLGVTPHGLRHQYANDLFEEHAGQPSAVRGGAVIDREADIRARHQVTKDLGHARLSITTAYTGPRPRGRPAEDKASKGMEGNGEGAHG